MTACRHFLTLADFTATELGRIVDRAAVLKEMHRNGVCYQPLRGKTLAMVFDLASTRTRVAFESGMNQLGGHAVFIGAQDSHLGRGEPLEDTARVLSEMVDAVAIRTLDHGRLEHFASYCTVPVINAMTSTAHPCQLLADMQTFNECHGDIAGAEVAFIGDGYNMCQSYIRAAPLFDFNLRVATPPSHQPEPSALNGNARVRVVETALEAVAGADLVVTDVWSSMGHEGQEDDRLKTFAGFQVTPDLLGHAADNALFMHCLPAHRGEEVSADMLDHPRAVVWTEAGNRLHSQKALLEYLLVH